jgi:hypothetical protein
MRIAAIIGFVLLWFLNYSILQNVYDVSVYEQYLQFWKARGIIYDSMFCCVALLLFVSYRGVEKALSCFMVVVTLGSVIDKLLFEVTGYVRGDIILVLLGMIASYIVYARDRKRNS